MPNDTNYNDSNSATWKYNNKTYPIVKRIEDKNLLLLSIPIEDIFDHYTSVTKEQFDMALQRAKSIDLRKALKCINSGS